MSDTPQTESMRSVPPPFFRQLDAINDEFFIIKRLLEKPTACMAAPEIMDVLRMATVHVHGRYEQLAFNMRGNAKEQP